MPQELHDSDGEIRDLQHEVWGPPRNPERGLVQRQTKTEKDLAPIVGLFRGATWPLRIIALGLVSALTGGIVNLIRMWLSR